MITPGQAYTPAQLLPHAGDMRLVDRVEDYGADWIRAGIDVAGRGLFGIGDGRVPAWLGLEYMAQTVAAYAGIERLQGGREVAVGLLIGSRRYEATLPHFIEGWRLAVIATLLMRDGDELAVFDCVLRHGDEVIARADVKAFCPQDIDEFMRSRR